MYNFRNNIISSNNNTISAKMPDLPSGLYLERDGAHRSLPQLSLQAKAAILSSVARTTLTQTFHNPWPDSIPELRYTFPLYDGVSVVRFTCTINRDRVIRGVVQAKQHARQTFARATARGHTASLLEQLLPSAGDVFTTTIGNVPGDAEIEVEIVVLGELAHDAETDGLRFTIPTHIAPRYGPIAPYYSSDAAPQALAQDMTITVDVEMAPGCAISSLQSPSHPIAVGLVGSSPHLATASLALGRTPLDRDFVLQVVATHTNHPVALLETHPTLPHQRALMATLVPRFHLPPQQQQRPEIVFVCDRSGSMGGGRKMAHLRTALQLFLKSLPLGVHFNICSFGSRCERLFPDGSQPYTADSLATALRYAETMTANMGGTEMKRPLTEVFAGRLSGPGPSISMRRNLEVVLLTDGDVWEQKVLIQYVHDVVTDSRGTIRLFTLAMGRDASHALVQGLARAGRGFSQAVGDDERMENKVIRMLKGALTPHIDDYTLEVKYKGHEDEEEEDDDEGFDLIDRVADLAVDVLPANQAQEGNCTAEPSAPPQQPISLFDPNFDPNAQIESFPSPARLPTVTVPRILQAPYEIPPLYAFNRTTVYLLLAPETGDKIPESVILRATSQYGPLELEIPVTTTTTAGTTMIHQLAARKAVHELEEGRGWIYHAKTKKVGRHDDGDDAGLLRDLYPSEFAGLVEREAVRLGVQFQVAGRWCSFVAVEEDDDNNADNNANDDQDMDPATIVERVSSGGGEQQQPPSSAEIVTVTAARQQRYRHRAGRKAKCISRPVSLDHVQSPSPFSDGVAPLPVPTGSSSMMMGFGSCAGVAPRQARVASPLATTSQRAAAVPPSSSSLHGRRLASSSAFAGQGVDHNNNNLFARNNNNNDDDDGKTTRGAFMSLDADSLYDSPAASSFASSPSPSSSSLFAHTTSLPRLRESVPTTQLSSQAFGTPLLSSGGGLFGQASSTTRLARAGQGQNNPFRAQQQQQYGMPVTVVAAAATSTVTTPDETTLQKLIRLQDFSGSWACQPDVLDATRVTQDRFDKVLWGVPMHTSYNSLGPTKPSLAGIISTTTTGKEGGEEEEEGGAIVVDVDRLRVAATMAVLVFLRTHLVTERDAWELVGDKALAWLEGTYGSPERVGEAVAAAERILT